jgi:aromatic-L-amino-acid decarboxylase
LLETVNDSGQLYLTHTKIDGVMILRMSIGGAATTRAHVERAWSVLLATASQVQATHGGA